MSNRQANRGRTTARGDLDVHTLATEIVYELRGIITLVNNYLNLIPRNIDRTADVDAIVSFSNTRRILETIAVVPILAERAGVLVTHDISTSNPRLCDTLHALVEHILLQVKALDGITRSLNIYALMPTRSYDSLSLLKNAVRQAAGLIKPNSELRADAELYPEWRDTTRWLATLSNALFDVFDRYMTFLESQVLRHNQVTMISDGRPMRHNVGPDGLPEPI